MLVRQVPIVSDGLVFCVLLAIVGLLASTGIHPWIPASCSSSCLDYSLTHLHRPSVAVAGINRLARSIQSQSSIPSPTQQPGSFIHSFIPSPTYSVLRASNRAWTNRQQPFLPTTHHPSLLALADTLLKGLAAADFDSKLATTRTTHTHHFSSFFLSLRVALSFLRDKPSVQTANFLHYGPFFSSTTICALFPPPAIGRVVGSG